MNIIYTAALTALLGASPDGGTLPVYPASSQQPARLVNHVDNELCLETTSLGLDKDQSFMAQSKTDEGFPEVALKTILTKKGYVVFDNPDTNRDSTIPILSVHYLGRGSSVGTAIFSLRDSQNALHWSTLEEYTRQHFEDDLKKVIPPSCSLLRRGVETEGKQASFGYLRINSRPPSEIWIDDYNTFLSTPVVKHRVPVGKHTITLRNYRQRCEGTYDINVGADQTVVLVKQLECK